ITLLQVIMQLLFLWIMLLFVGQRHIDIYIYSLYVSYSVAFIFSFIYLVKEIKDFRIENLLKTAGSIIRYGGFVQLSNILQLLNYRLAYYIIDFYQGKVLLGIFTLGVQLSEGLWLLSKSAATVQYSKISNTKDKLYIKNFTNKLVKITFFSTLLLLIPLLLLPEAFFISVFGREFGDARFVLLYMSPGILAVAVNSMFSHYFSGTGRHHYNTIGSAIGLAVTLGVGLILIPRYALTGAAFTASVSYFCSFIFQLLVYKNITKSGLIDFMPVKSDLYYIIGKIKSFFGK
ncbi:MAG: polysaccharide biosynthesis C-terminal domain-containing protein, partial [Bacteroidales bacterium]|nr:polysaccharide biosynthesis C-terminal domain-containing protein [Bacteroidales bacterium]